MGVWSLRGLFYEIKKWEELAESQDISELDREIYLARAEIAKATYERERSTFTELKDWAN